MFISKALVFATSQSPVPIRGKWSGIKTNVFIVQVNPMNKGWERNNFFYGERMNFPLSFLLHLIVVIHRYWFEPQMSIFNTLTLIHNRFSYKVYLRLALFANRVFLRIQSKSTFWQSGSRQRRLMANVTGKFKAFWTNLATEEWKSSTIFCSFSFAWSLKINCLEFA